MLKCTKFDFRWGSAPDPAGEAYSTPLDLLAAFKGPISKGRAGEKERKKKGGVRGCEGREKEGPAPSNTLG